MDALAYLIDMMPHASMRLFSGGGDSIPAIREQPQILRVIRDFIGVPAPAFELDTVLATVLFTDIVNSTELHTSLGDEGWKPLVGRHHEIVREALARWRGVENDTAGDGFYATFDGPARAIRCAQEVVERVRDLGIEVRAGVHTGEATVIDGKVGGLGRGDRRADRRCGRAVGDPGVADRQGPHGGLGAHVRGHRRVRAQGHPRAVAPAPRRVRHLSAGHEHARRALPQSA